MAPTDIPPRNVDHFEDECDVVVVGLGLAGATTAIEACDLGLDVIVLEKMAVPGGISITAGGGFVLTNDVQKALAYLRATNRDTIAEPILVRFAEGMAELQDYIASLARTNGAVLTTLDIYGSYPFPGVDAFRALVVDSIPGFDPDREYPHVQGSGGRYTFKLFLDHVLRRPIDVRYSTPAARLITDASGEVRGVWARLPDGGHIAIRARRGVVLTCGGFENNPELQREYWPIGAALPASFLGNTGDGIRMALDVGAGLWHMWHFHGAIGFRHPDPACPIGIRTKSLPMWTEGYKETAAPMAWIIVDQYGRRFMNEYPPYFLDTGHRGIEHVEMRTGTTPRIPCYMIVDDLGRRLYRLGEPHLNDDRLPAYPWASRTSESGRDTVLYDSDYRSFDEANLDQVEKGLLKRFDTIDELARHIGCEPAVLQQTLDTWNAGCEKGADDQFGRPPKSMVPVSRAPFILGELWPVVSNTQGGPAHDERQRILNSFGQPIPGLYEAGECGGIWGFLYLGAGNYSECVIGGRIAAQELAGRT